MACESITRQGQSLADRMEEVRKALARLNSALASGAVKVVIAPNGAIAFAGWAERDGVSDACAYRTLTAESSAALRLAIARAEGLSGRKVNARAVAAGHHSHDGGRTWGHH